MQQEQPYRDYAMLPTATPAPLSLVDTDKPSAIKADCEMQDVNTEHFELDRLTAAFPQLKNIVVRAHLQLHSCSRDFLW